MSTMVALAQQTSAGNASSGKSFNRIRITSDRAAAPSSSGRRCSGSHDIKATADAPGRIGNGCGITEMGFCQQIT
jgi:hypothetical protein